MAKIIQFPNSSNSRKKAKNAAPRPSQDELRRALDAAVSVIEEANHTMNYLEAELVLYKEITDRHSKYLLTLVQLLIREGYELPTIDEP
jgi:hypothetical protein